MKFYVKSKLSENVSKTPEGFLLCRNVILTHTGPLLYTKGEHPFEDQNDVIITRTPAELFSIKTKASFEGKDITIEHPEDFIDTENYQQLTNGVMFNLRKHSEKVDVDGEMFEALACDFLIKSAEAIEWFEDGGREVSLGYEADWELLEDGKGVHTNIKGNHCALVEAGRAGVNCAIQDSKKERTMTKELAEKFQKMFGKKVEDAIAEKEKEEADKAKDAEKAKDQKISDLEAMVKDLIAKVEGKDKTKDEDKKDKESKDESEDPSAARLAKIEEMLSKLMEKIAGVNSEDEGDSETDEVVAEDEDEDEDDSEGEEANDEECEDEDGSEKVKDSLLSKAEILSPGIQKSKDMVKQALKKAYSSTDGKKVIDSLTNGKGVEKLTGEAELIVFNAAAAALKTKRSNDYASTKVVTIDSFPALAGKNKGSMTPEMINEQNRKFYNNK